VADGFVEQLVVRPVSNGEVRGSKPRRSTFGLEFLGILNPETLPSQKPYIKNVALDWVLIQQKSTSHWKKPNSLTHPESLAARHIFMLKIQNSDIFRWETPCWR